MAGTSTPLTKGVFPAMLTDPHADEVTQPFWDAAKEGRLVCQQCTSCGTFRMPPSRLCFQCRSREYTFTELPGTATIYSFTIVRHPLNPAFAECCPYVAAVVELDGTQGAGARMIVNVIDVEPESVRIGDRVEVVFDPVSETLSVPRFRPVRD